MSGVVKLDAIKSLVATIAAGVPELADRQDTSGNPVHPIKVVQVPPDQKLKFPSLAIVPARFRFEPNQERVHAEPTAETAVINVGRWVCTMQFRLGCATFNDRYVLEEKLSSLFMAREDAPGVMLTQVVEPALGDFTAAWELDDSEWEDEMAFSSQNWAMLVFTGVIPVLVTRPGIYPIDTLRVGFTHDFETAFADNFTTHGNLKVVQVAADGTITTV
jgi:hypothetical protein